MKLQEIKDLLPDLPNKQKWLLRVMMDGKKRSAADFSIVTHFSDPRSIIANLRNKGVPIYDEWRVNAQKDGRYKVYFLRPSDKESETDDFYR